MTTYVVSLYWCLGASAGKHDELDINPYEHSDEIAEPGIQPCHPQAQEGHFQETHPERLVLGANIKTLLPTLVNKHRIYATISIKETFVFHPVI